MNKKPVTPATSLKLLLYLTVTLFFVHVCSQMLFIYTKPALEQVQLGRIYPLNVHGAVVYLTWSEYLVAGLPLFTLSTICGFAWALLSWRNKHR